MPSSKEEIGRKLVTYCHGQDPFSVVLADSMTIVGEYENAVHPQPCPTVHKLEIKNFVD
jgi:hypothetical protein